ncbi:flagellar motor switch protein FliN [Demequina subtropica]|uniref:flagellar motor switch protein FliN n=1 Tax=Demequina subtropica TaxID=1638989 RepID=UPI0007814612|nr:flagellar motor switch protein FliN [Demequina subtropica]
MTTLTTARGAAEQLAAQIPSAVPLTVADLAAGMAPAADAACVRAHFVGATSADLMVVADEVIADAIAAAGGDVSAAEILRPALEAAASNLGAGVLDTARVDALGDAFGDADTEVFALVDATGTARAWFAMRVRAAAPAPAAAGRVDAASERSRMRVLHDVELVLTAEIGRTRLPMRQVLDLVPGTVLELDRSAGAPADVMVNGRLVARGEVVVIDEDYGIRISEIVATDGGH